ncbi:MAG TPA: twin-arginine translocase TatA/TatE family subunit [Gemmatimonadales bacterium]
MNFGNLGFTEILILVLILVLFFGAKRIPEIGASIGQGIKQFKRSLSDSGEREESRDLPAGGAGSAVPPSSSGDPKRLNQ